MFLYDEYGSTKATRERFKEMGVRRSKRLGHLDANAAQTILQNYLDEQYYSTPLTESTDQGEGFE